MFNYKMKKLIPGGKYKTRPSASYFLNTLKAPVGHEVVYRKKKGGPMVKHTLQMKKGKRIPYWKPVETSSKKKRINKRSSRRSSRRTSRRRSSRRTSRRRTRRTSRRRTRRTSRRSSRRRSKRTSQNGGENGKIHQGGG